MSCIASHTYRIAHYLAGNSTSCPALPVCPIAHYLAGNSTSYSASDTWPIAHYLAGNSTSCPALPVTPVVSPIILLVILHPVLLRQSHLSYRPLSCW